MRGSVKSIKMKYLLLAFAVTAAVALPLRVYQLLNVVETDTGFFASSDVSVTVLYCVLAVFCIGVMLLSFLSAEVPSPKLPVGKNRALGVASALFGIGLLWSIVDVLVSIVETLRDKGGFLSSVGFAEFLKEQGGPVALIKIVVAFLGAIYLFVFCVSHFDGKASYKDQRVLALMPLMWSMCGLIFCLTQAIAFIKVSELFFDMCMYAFGMLFLMNFARFSSGVIGSGNKWEIYGFGLPAALFALIVSVPRLIVFIMGKDAVASHAFDISDLTFGIFIIVYIFASLGLGFRDVVTPEEVVIRELQPGELDETTASDNDEEAE